MAGKHFLPRAALDELIAQLISRGYHCIGPRLRDGAIVYEPLSASADLPQGVHQSQAPGHFRIEHSDSPRCFAWANGPAALKPQVFAPSETVWRAARDANGHIGFEPVVPEPPAMAVIGVRACDLAALDLQDRHFLAPGRADAAYRARRERLFLVAVNCTHPAATCFCASTGDGPEATFGYDLVMDELDDGYLLMPGTDAGRQVVEALGLAAADEAQSAAAREQLQAAGSAQVRALPGRNLRDALFANLNHSRWDDVAGRCLSCGNCTSVCPTCFCHSEHDEPRLDGTASEHRRQWDSCFTQGHSYIHGFTVRADTRQRYRQWLTHKLGSWHDQYGRSGCVGCGRCITWCPTGIDITVEAQALCGDAVDE